MMSNMCVFVMCYLDCVYRGFSFFPLPSNFQQKRVKINVKTCLHVLRMDFVTVMLLINK